MAGLVCGFAPEAVGQGSLAERVMAARLDAGADPQRALAALRALRLDAAPQAGLAGRFAVDEAECRVLTDLDTAQAVAVTDAGLALVAAEPAPPARDPWLRLRACRAGMLVQMGETTAARTEFDALLALAVQPGDAAVRGLVLMERGVHRTRSGDWDGAQQDLIAACEQLKTQGPPLDHALCLGHLANHYRRVGDTDEALRLLQSLHAAARQRGATFDTAVYAFGIGQGQQAQRRWAEAIDSFEASAAASRQVGDRTGVAYAEHGIAQSQLKLGRARDALASADRALSQLDPASDPRQHEVIRVTRAEALVALGRAAEANAELERVEAAVRKRGDQPSVADWLLARADAQRLAGHWREAYQALADARAIEQQLQELRESRQSARLRMQFNRSRDAEDISALRQLNEQGQRLRQTQAVALVLFVILLGVAVGVALRKFRQARQLQSLASTDELTGLANRRALMAFAHEATADAQRENVPLALLMVDIDHFKRINDAHGHPVGDEVLRHAARVLSAGLRERDRLGRVGGEEFVAVLPRATLEQARLVAERMRKAVEDARLAGPAGELCFTVSIGVAGLRRAETADALLQRADAALYAAKHGGRNAVVVDADAAGR
ncbi:MAG: diguanylate cyclase [Rubrivivax sp.]|nr:diguanylate cyclase [Rubrivivax sp.]